MNNKKSLILNLSLLFTLLFTVGTLTTLLINQFADSSGIPMIPAIMGIIFALTITAWTVYRILKIFNKQLADINLNIQYLRGMNSPVMAIDSDFNVSFMNQAGGQVLGLDPKDCTGKKCFDLFKTDDCRTEKCACDQAMRQNQAVTSTTIARAGGGALPIQYTASPLKDANGKVTGAVELVSDITGLRKTQTEADLKVKYLQGLNSPVMTIDCDFNVAFMNEAGGKVLGMDSKDCTGRKCFDLFKTDDCRTEKCACDQAMRQNKAATSETIARTGGRELPIQYTASPLLDANGKVIGAVELVTDITELKQIIDSLNNVVQQISISAEQLKSGSNQLSDSSQQLSQGTSEQASSIEQMNSTIVQFSAQLKQSSENSSEVKNLSLKSLESVRKGTSKIKEMVEAMSSITISSEQIAKIMKTIDEIAFQTNLLALNAAVEAARAGRHGKGFAVVAEEVNNLSKRSASAAKESAEIITESIKKINLGNNIANETENVFKEISAGIEKVTKLTEETSIASEEQVKGITQVEQGIQQIDQVTQQNASIAQQSSSASEELSGQANELNALVSKFRQGDGNGGIPKEDFKKLESPSIGNGNYAHNSRGNPKDKAPKGKIVVPEEIIALSENSRKKMYTKF
jgi:methyl-accepting chemotaxis protein